MLLQTLFIYSSFIVVMYICGLRIEQKSQSLTLSGATFGNKAFFQSAIFMFLFFAILVGLRYDVGTDHLGYWTTYLEGSNSRQEFLYRQLSNICRAIGLHPTFFFGILGLIQIVFFYWAFRDEPFLFPFFAIFLFTDGLFGSWMNTIRQDVAGCIWIFAFYNIIQRKPIKYLVLCFVAFLFHRSAIILIVLYPLFNKGKEYIYNIPLQLATLFVAYLMKNNIELLLLRLDNLFSFYSNVISLGNENEFYTSYSVEAVLDNIGQNVADVRQTGLGKIVKYMVYICIVLYSNKMKDFFKSPKVNALYVLFYISFISYIVLPPGVWSLARPLQYFNCTRVIMMSYLVYYLLKNKQGYNGVIGISIIILQILLLLASNIVASHSVFYHGYQLFFQV